MSSVLELGREPDPAKRLRKAWAEALDEAMKIAGVSRKELRRRLADQGIEVTEQAIGSWLRAETAPRAHHQAAVATALQVPVRSLFNVEAA